MADVTQNQSAMPVYIMGAQADGTETFPLRTTPNQDAGVADVLVSGGVNGAVVVGVVAIEAKVGSSRLTNRKTLTVMPTDGSVFWGYSSSVTTANGTEIFRNQMATFSVSDAVSIWLISSTNRNVRVTEGA